MSNEGKMKQTVKIQYRSKTKDTFPGRSRRNVIPYNRDTKIFYNEEFDPGSGGTLATGLTHASRGAA